MLLVFCQLSRNVIGYEDSKCDLSVSILVLPKLQLSFIFKSNRRLAIHSIVISFADLSSFVSDGKC